MLAMTSLTPRASVLRLGSTLGLSITTLSTSLMLSLQKPVLCTVHVYFYY